MKILLKIKVKEEDKGWYNIYVNGKPTYTYIRNNDEKSIDDIETVINENILDEINHKEKEVFRYVSDFASYGMGGYYIEFSNNVNHEFNIFFDNLLFEKLINETEEEKISELLVKLIIDIIKDINKIEQKEIKSGLNLLDIVKIQLDK